MIEREYIIDDYVMVGKKKFMLNMNTYRNACYHVLSDAKINFKNNIIAEHIDILTYKFDKVKISYTVIPHNKVLFDVMNVVSVVDKFFCDSLVECGTIPDDSYIYVSYGELVVGNIVKGPCKKIIINCVFY